MPDPPQNQSPQVSFQQPYTPPPAPQFVGVPPARPRSSSAKILLIIVAVFAGLGLVGVGVVGVGVWYVAKNMNRVSSAQFTESDLGIAIYPGATPSKMGMQMEVGPMRMVSAYYLTPDSTEQVTAFYKEKAGSEASIMTLANVASIHVRSIGGDSLSIEISPRADALGNKTQIKINHVIRTGASN